MLDPFLLVLLGGSFSRVSSVLSGMLERGPLQTFQLSVFLSLLLVPCSVNASCSVLPGFSAPPGSSSLHHHGLEILSRWEAGESRVLPFCAPSLRDHCPPLSNVEGLGLGILLVGLHILIHKRGIITITAPPSQSYCED